MGKYSRALNGFGPPSMSSKDKSRLRDKWTTIISKIRQYIDSTGHETSIIRWVRPREQERAPGDRWYFPSIVLTGSGVMNTVLEKYLPEIIKDLKDIADREELPEYLLEQKENVPGAVNISTTDGSPEYVVQFTNKPKVSQTQPEPLIPASLAPREQSYVSILVPNVPTREADHSYPRKEEVHTLPATDLDLLEKHQLKAPVLCKAVPIEATTANGQTTTKFMLKPMPLPTQGTKFVKVTDMPFLETKFQGNLKIELLHTVQKSTGHVLRSSAKTYKSPQKINEIKKEGVPSNVNAVTKGGRSQKGGIEVPSDVNDVARGGEFQKDGAGLTSHHHFGDDKDNGLDDPKPCHTLSKEDKEIAIEPVTCTVYSVAPPPAKQLGKSKAPKKVPLPITTVKFTIIPQGPALKPKVTHKSMYVCSKISCTEKFEDQSSFLEHMKKHLPKWKRSEMSAQSAEGNPAASKDQSAHYTPKVVPTARIICNISNCGKTFGADEDVLLETHLDEHKTDQLSTQDITRLKLMRIKVDKIRKRKENGTHKCDKCTLAFVSQNDLEVHSSRHAKKRFTCNVCFKMFQYERTRNAHLTYHQDNTTCRVCDKAFEDKFQLYKHAFQHEEATLKCTYCDKMFSDPAKLSSHVRSHEKKKGIFCEICGKTFCRKQNFDIHYKSHTGDRSYVCHKCGRSFTCQNYLTMHMKWHLPKADRPHKCYVCNKGFVRKLKCTAHEKICGKYPSCRKYNCRYCDEVFDSRVWWTNHMDTQHAEEVRLAREKEILECDFCERRFSEQLARCRHIRQKHTKEGQPQHKCHHCANQAWHRRYPCLYCDVVFLSAAKRIRHEKSVHAQERRHPRTRLVKEKAPSRKTFDCDFCKKKFMIQLSKCKHMKTHAKEGEEPHNCTHCDKSEWERKRILRRDERRQRAYQLKLKRKAEQRASRRVERLSAPKLYTCKLCRAMYKEMTDLVNHVALTHYNSSKSKWKNPIVCARCGRMFLKYGNYRVHFRHHTGEKPFPCKYCGDFFINPVQRHSHELNHTGERPFSCNFCDKMFRLKRDVQKHTKRIHLKIRNPPSKARAPGQGASTSTQAGSVNTTGDTTFSSQSQSETSTSTNIIAQALMDVSEYYEIQ